MAVAGLDRAKCKNVQCDVVKLGQDLNDIHVADIFSLPKVMDTASRTGLTLGLAFDMSRSCWNLNAIQGTPNVFGSACTPRGATGCCRITQVQRLHRHVHPGPNSA